MAMKFSNDTLEKIFNEVIKDAVSKTGFEIRRLDEERRAGLIDDKLRVEIRRSKFLIADLSDDNNGAYWEAGYAEGLGMPVIYICEESKFDQRATHFDTNHHLTIKWKDDPESLKKFAEELKATIRATFPAEAKMED
jgi:nucleoside 2-deoxyribosyltransferase